MDTSTASKTIYVNTSDEQRYSVVQGNDRGENGYFVCRESGPFQITVFVSEQKFRENYVSLLAWQAKQERRIKRQTAKPKSRKSKRHTDRTNYKDVCAEYVLKGMENTSLYGCTDPAKRRTDEYEKDTWDTGIRLRGLSVRK